MEIVFPTFTYILDYTHLKSHLLETAEALDIDEALRSEWVDSFVNEHWDEHVDDWETHVAEIIARLEQVYTRQDHLRLERLIDHLSRFCDAVEYRRFDQRGWPTGSGEVESAHRQLSQARLKLAGASWKVDNINPMLALIVITANGWWVDFVDSLRDEILAV